jgi:hypothetical protein
VSVLRHYLFASQAELDRAAFKTMLGLGERMASAQVAALLQRGLVASDTPYGKLRFGVPLHALRFYLPSLWPETEATRVESRLCKVAAWNPN